mgnify:CR=1 FL=1
MKISTLNRKYKNMWVLAEVLKEDTAGPIDVKPLVVSHDRDEVYKGIGKVPKGKVVATLYTGKVTGPFLFFICHR